MACPDLYGPERPKLGTIRAFLLPQRNRRRTTRRERRQIRIITVCTLSGCWHTQSTGFFQEDQANSLFVHKKYVLSIFQSFSTMHRQQSMIKHTFLDHHAIAEASMPMSTEHQRSRSMFFGETRFLLEDLTCWRW